MAEIHDKLLNLFKALSRLPGRNWGLDVSNNRIMFEDASHIVPAEMGKDLDEYEALRRAPSLEGSGRGAHGDGDRKTFDAIARVLYHAAEFRDLLEHPTLRALLAVLAERERQVSVEGFGSEHDDNQHHFEITYAAAWYMLAASDIPMFNDVGNPPTLSWPVGKEGRDTIRWPWDDKWWKPKTQERNLERAVALGIAAMERQYRYAEYVEFKKLPEDEVLRMTQEVLTAAGYTGGAATKPFKEALKAVKRGLLRVKERGL